MVASGHSLVTLYVYKSGQPGRRRETRNMRERARARARRTVWGVRSVPRGEKEKKKAKKRWRERERERIAGRGILMLMILWLGKRMLVIFLIVPFASSHIVWRRTRCSGVIGRGRKNDAARVSALLKIDTYKVSLLWDSDFIARSIFFYCCRWGGFIRRNYEIVIFQWGLSALDALFT